MIYEDFLLENITIILEQTDEYHSNENIQMILQQTSNMNQIEFKVKFILFLFEMKKKISRLKNIKKYFQGLNNY